MREYQKIDSFHRLPIETQNVLLHLNIADDYFKAKAYVEKLEKEVEIKDKELYNLKHDLISNQIKAESDEARKNVKVDFNN